MGLIDRYDVLRRLGRGAAGDVSLARDRLAGGREVALKTIRARVDDVLMAAFEREFLTMASLSLPGVAQVYDFGVMRERRESTPSPFFTRAYIDGMPLDEATEGLDLAARLALFIKVAQVIAPLHRAGVVHGDIKPGNAIIDAHGRAWLIDFGLSRMRGYDRSADSHGPVGTPTFMSPELLRGESPTASADLYALGVTLWVLVLGQYPYASLGARAMSAKLDGKPPEIPASCDAQTRAALGVAQRALARDPMDRFPNASELVISLARLLPQGASAAISDEEAPRAFVLPRPRGHAELLQALEGAIAARPALSAVWHVQAPTGGGKSLFLRELKWRLQLASHVVFEVFAGRASGARPLLSLLDQLIIALGEEHASSRAAEPMLVGLRAGKLDESAASDVLGDLFAAVAKEASVVVLVDDLDHADAVFGAVLRSAVHAESTRGVALVVTAEGAHAAAVRELHPDHVLVLPKLSYEDAAALAGEALGPLDSSVVASLVEHAQGLPGALVSALYRLSALPAVTSADVQALPPAEVALALAHARLGQVSLRARPLLHALALLTALAENTVSDSLRLLGGASRPPDAAARLVTQLEAAGLIVRDAGSVMLADRALRDALQVELGTQGQQQMAAALLKAAFADGFELADRARLAVLAGANDEIVRLVPPAAQALTQIGAHAAAAELLVALLAHTHGAPQRSALLDLARARHALGEDETAVTLAKRLAADPQASAQERAAAELLAARALTVIGRFDDAVAELGLVPDDVDEAQRACAQRELAKIHLRRGDYAAAERAAEAGLRIASPTDPVRIELLCSQGMVASYRGDHTSARACHEAALSMARNHGSRRDEANALTYLAIGCHRGGDNIGARDLLAQSLEIARELGDVGNMATYSLNLGAILFYLGEHAAAAEHYESAVRLSRRSGRLSTPHAQARNNLAHIHLYFGLYETARAEIEAVLRDALSAGHAFIVAQATHLLADLCARTGQVDTALIRYDDAIVRYTKLGQTRELAELNLDAAEALLDRGGPVDASAAAARLATARAQIEVEEIEDLRLRVELLIARARLANADADGVVLLLKDLVERARKAHDRDVEWAALVALSIAHEQSGTGFGARRHARMAVEVLEEIALRVPREHREAFWHDPRRRAVRERANESERSSLGVERSDAQTGEPDSRTERERLLEILKRLAREHDLPRLLDRITESAVELSGAERGSVLLVGEDGNLAPQVTRARTPAQEEAHAAFSRSIAEAVLIDGEPIVTVDATQDGRLQSYVSVHKLMLRSVACLPIRGHSSTLGVLYLEHRRSRGRFSEQAVDLLCAFADQAAIALENARLIEQTQRQKLELEEANQELSRAKGDLEDALLLRTRQLDDVQRELSRATRQGSQENRHGIIGRSASMQRVFDGIGRLAGNAVPVVVCGESGTGKELVARAIHYGGVRAQQPFVAIQCGSLPDTLLESELFGHVKGAFSGADRDRRGTIAAASGGTLFLDEVSEMSPKMQVGLLRVLQERKVCRVGSEVEEPVDVRLLASSQKPLAELVARGAFREDLFYRLSVVEVVLPPLRERREDIPALCEHFLREFATRESVPRRHLTRAALARLMEHAWPGNVRQLSHVLLQACVMAEGSAIDVSDLALGQSQPPLSAADPSLSDLVAMVPRSASLDDHKLLEKQRILEALEACGWNRVRAAQTLGMPRRTFYRRLSDYSIL
jgi:transcriptional regulator with GAF, ATPase, and Fis domain/predicted Ser/Thr protein kinase/Tfp pilus assembly protein PilF